VGQNRHDPEGKKSLEQKFGRKSIGRKCNFKPAPLLHFHSAADRGLEALKNEARGHSGHRGEGRVSTETNDDERC
jgi:hypothetical protein